MHRATLRLFAILALVGAAACDTGADEAAEAPAADTAAAATSDTAAAAQATDGALIDPETATAEQLTSVPGIDAALAERIIAARPIENMLEVDAILAETLSEEQRDTVYARMFKPIDLNTASGEEMQLIPGVGDRMQHEFEEYRPWRTIEQFRREIGKYVDEDEVARLERYVAIR